MESKFNFDQTLFIGVAIVRPTTMVLYSSRILKRKDYVNTQRQDRLKMTQQKVDAHPWAAAMGRGLHSILEIN